MMKILSLLAFLLISEKLYAQHDSLVYRHYNNHITIYSLTGFNTTNVSINPKFGNFDRQRFVLNPPLLLGFGVTYKGFDLGITRRLPMHLLNERKYGKSDYFDLKLKFSFKRVHFALRAQNYSGFTLLNHQYDDPELPKPHIFLEDISTFSVNLDTRYFFKKDFSYKAALGFSGEYLQDVFTPYIYGYSGVSGISNNHKSLLPDYIITDSASISRSSQIGCVEFGAIPGVAYVKRHNNIQGTVLLGWGPLIQAKWIGAEQTQGFFGFSSRTDLQWSVGYHSRSWFVQVMSEVQFRRINFKQLNYQQFYYDLRLFLGFLIPVKKHPKIILLLENKGLI